VGWQSEGAGKIQQLLHDDLCIRLLVEQQDLENEIKETFSVEYGDKNRRSGKRRFADMNGNEETMEDDMPALNVAAIDSFFDSLFNFLGIVQ